MAEVSVHRGRVATLPVKLSYDLSEDAITSQIRAGRTVESELIAEWVVTFRTDGKDGALVLTLSDTVTAAITQDIGYMDLKRIHAGQPLAVFDDPIMVVFKGVVTA